MAQVRSSLARPQPSLVYQLSAADGALPTVDWFGTSAISADDVLACAGHRGRGPRDLAATFLEQFLAAGPRTSRDVWEAAKKAALSARTLNRAKKELGIRCRRRHHDGQPVSYWLLPDQELAREPNGDPALDRLFADLEKKYPPHTPLDEEDPD